MLQRASIKGRGASERDEKEIWDHEQDKTQGFSHVSWTNICLFVAYVFTCSARLSYRRGHVIDEGKQVSAWT